MSRASWFPWEPPAWQTGRSGWLTAASISVGGKEDLAACLRQFLDGVGAGVVLRDVGAHQDLGVIVNPQGLAGGLQALDVVLVIGILLLPRQKQADLDGVCGGGGFGVPLILAAGGQGEEKGSG